jgi:hypothetical protein
VAGKCYQKIGLDKMRLRCHGHETVQRISSWGKAALDAALDADCFVYFSAAIHLIDK